MPHKLLSVLQPGHGRKSTIPPAGGGGGEGASSPYDNGVVEAWNHGTGSIPLLATDIPDPNTNTLVGVARIPVNAFGAADLAGFRSLLGTIKGIVQWGGRPPTYIRIRDLRDTSRIQSLVGFGTNDILIDSTAWLEGEQFTVLSLSYKP